MAVSFGLSGESRKHTFAETEIEVIGARLHPCRRQHARPPEQARHPKLLLVEGVSVQHAAALEQLVAVIGSQNQEEYRW